MRIERLQPHAVIQDHAVAVDAEPARVQHLAAISGLHRRIGDGSQIEAQVDLLIHVLAAVDVGSLVGEARLDRRIEQLLERALPQDLRRGLACQ